jgi:hypothetical protein
VRYSVMKLRRAALGAVAAISVAMALFLVWYLVTPARIAAAPLTGLLGVLALMVLPGATLAAWELDRRALSRIPAELLETAPEPEAASASPEDVVADLGRLEIIPEPAPRQALIHERPAPAGEPRHRHRIADRSRQN